MSRRIRSRPRVLYICHNHPDLHPGGSEIFAHDLFRAVGRSGAAETLFLACTNQVHRESHPGTSFLTVGRSSDEVVLWAGHFDHFSLSQVDLHGVMPQLERLLLDFRPTVVHFHHLLLIGVEALFLVRRVLPEATLVLTLHDYYAICPHLGQMVTPGDHRLCRAASPGACARCFPERTPEQLLLRERHLKALLGLVDGFIAPSRFLRDRYVAWGLPAERIQVVRNGRPQPAHGPAPHRSLGEGGRRDAFACFGNVSPFKGTLVAVEAMRRMAAEGPPAPGGGPPARLTVHGGMPFQADDTRAAFTSAVAAAGPAVRHAGPYTADDIPARMADADWVVMPSIWWENAPLVIQEAFQHRRPVLCSGIGGMAEAVTDGVNGLLVRPGDPDALADAMRRAVSEPGLWQRLVDGIPPVPGMTETVAAHLDLYHRLDRRPGPRPPRLRFRRGRDRPETKAGGPGDPHSPPAVGYATPAPVVPAGD